MVSRLQELTETIYDAALDPAGWAPAVTSVQAHFHSTAAPLYVHHDERRQIHAIHRGGIADAFVQSFPEMTCLPDYPWRRAPALRGPGVIRTEARLIAVTGDTAVMRRSIYFNEWLRPQRLEQSIGITLSAEDDLTARFTLLRPDKAGPFRRGEAYAFAALSGALRRAFAFSRRLALQAEHADAGTAVLDRLGWGRAILELDGRLRHANRAAEALLRAADCLRLEGGRLVAADHRDRARLARFLAAAAEPAAVGPDGITLRRRGGRPPLTLSAIRLSGEHRAFAVGEPMILLLLADPATRRPGGSAQLQALYRLTPAETRLAEALLAGDSLKRAGDGAGITYEIARWHLKALFQKTGTNRQAELVARLLHDIVAVPLV